MKSGLPFFLVVKDRRLPCGARSSQHRVSKTVLPLRVTLAPCGRSADSVRVSLLLESVLFIDLTLTSHRFDCCNFMS